MKILQQMFLLILLCAISFWVTEEDGFVALQESGKGVIYKSDTPISALPTDDASAIRSKIPCYSAEEAARYMENFCS